MRRWLSLGVAVAVLVIGVAASYQAASVASRSGDDAAAYSVRRHDPSGVAALFDLLTERGVPTRAVERPSLDPADRGVLIQVVGEQQAFRGSVGRHVNTRQLADWIADGNTVIQFTREPTELMAHFKLAAATQPVRADVKAVGKAEAHGAAPSDLPGMLVRARVDASDAHSASFRAVGGAQITLRRPMEFVERPNDSRWTTLARSTAKGNAIVAGQYLAGRGRLILVGAPTPALNGTIADESNLDFILAAIGSGPVLVDEWSHGVGHETTIVRFLHDVGLLPVLLQVGVVAALYMWSTSGAGRLDERGPIRQRSSSEQIATLGFLYGRSLSPDIAFDRVAAEANRRLCDALRCRPNDLKGRIARLSPGLRGRADALLGRLADLRPSHRARCYGCGYDLALNESGKCPECGATIPGEQRRRIAEDAAAGNVPGGGEADRQRGRVDQRLAEVLTLSHELSQEIQREPNATR